MRLPTIALVLRAALQAGRRFPLVVGAGLVAAYAALALVHHGGDAPGDTRLLAAATLGFPLLFALTLVAERRARTPLARSLLLGAGVLVLLAFWAAWPGWSPGGRALRYAELSVAFHLLVAFLPYAGADEPNGFWQYNKALFVRFLTAALYSFVLYVGLAIALLALDRLLGVHVEREGYARLGIVIAFVFNTWFFVGGVPADLAALEARTEYPAGLRIFTQYVLVPIVAVYLVILTIYLGKVLVTRQWPSGWIGYLVSSVACAGILSWLLVHPLEERPEHAWVKAFTRGFYIVLMPSIAMLWLAIWKRIEQYGVTEPRYFLTVLSVWLGGIAAYYTVAHSRSIKVIPATLCAVVLASFAGPWSAYAVSRRSQAARVAAVLERDGLLVHGVLRPATLEVAAADRRAIHDGLHYLLAAHGARALAPWLGDSLGRALGLAPAGATPGGAESGARAIMAALNVAAPAPWETGAGQYVSYYADAPRDALDIDGYTYAVRFSNWSVRDSLRIAEGTVLRLSADSLGLEVVRRGALVLAIPLGGVVDSAAAYRRSNPGRPLPGGVLRLELRRGTARALAYFTQIAGMNRAGGTRLTAFQGELFLRLP